MPNATNDIVEVTLVGEQVNQEITNVYHYEKVTPTVDASEIAEQSASSFIQYCLPEISANYTLKAVRYRNLFDPSEAGEIDIIDQTGGDNSGQALPPHDTWSFSILHDEPSIRKGRKSLAGITETSSAGNGVFEATAFSDMQLAGFNWMTESVKDVATGLVDIGRPVIVKRIAEVVGAVTRYRYPTSIVEAVVGYVYDVVLGTYIRTQNSRKIGRGV